MTVTRSFPTGDSLSITDTRRVIGGLVVKNTDGTPRAGVFPAHTNPLVTGLSSMAYSVGVFAAATVRIAGGCELVANDAAVTVATTAAPAANRRIDVIWVRSRFTLHLDTSNLAEIGVTQGAAAASPVKPSIPAGALELATAEILSTTTTTATAVITQTHPYTAAAGGTVWLRNSTEQGAWTPANGGTAFRLDTGDFLQRVNGAWQLGGGDTGWLPLTLSTGWAAVGGHTPRGRLINGIVYLEGAVLRGSGGLQSNIAVIPAALRILGPGKTTFIGATFSSRSTGGAATSQMYTGESGVIGIEGYTTMDGTVGWVLPLTCDFVRDQR